MTTILTLDVETIAVDSEILDDYKAKFEPKPSEPEPETEVKPESKINPKTGKPKRKVANPKPKSEGRAKALKSTKPGLHWLTGRGVCVCVKPEGQEPVAFSDEKEEFLLIALHEYLMARFPYTLITFNGKAFDAPLLVMRGTLYGLDFASLLPSDRFSKNHIDLYEVIGGRWGMSATLAQLSWFLGLGEVEGKGSDVQQMFDEGRLEDIIAHCKSDVTMTERIFHRIMGDRKRKY